MTEQEKELTSPAKHPLPRLIGYGQTLLSVGAYVFVLGFVAYHAILRQRTTIDSFNVNPAIYAQTGLLLIEAIVQAFILPASVGIMLITLVLVFTLRILRGKSPTGKSVWAIIKEGILTVWLASASWWILIIVMLVWAALYPETIFASFKHPNAKLVTILFKDPFDPARLHLSVDPADKARTLPVFIVTELNDGLLIEDGNTGAIVEVKNDVVAGIVDDNHVTPTATAVPGSSTPAPTVAATPTP